MIELEHNVRQHQPPYSNLTEVTGSSEKRHCTPNSYERLCRLEKSRSFSTAALLRISHLTAAFVRKAACSPRDSRGDLAADSDWPNRSPFARRQSTLRVPKRIQKVPGFAN